MPRSGPGPLRLWLTNNPSSWLLIVLLPALVAGIVLGLGHRGEVIDLQAWWLLPAAGVAALEGISAGWLLGKRAHAGQIAGIGAVASGVVIGGAASMAATGSLDDPGGVGWPEAAGAMSAVLFVPMLVGVLVSRALSNDAGGDGGSSQADKRPPGPERQATPPFWPPPPGWRPPPTGADGRPRSRGLGQREPDLRARRGGVRRQSVRMQRPRESRPPRPWSRAGGRRD